MTFDEMGVQLLDEADVEKDDDDSFEDSDKVGRSEDEDELEEKRSDKAEDGLDLWSVLYGLE